MDQERVFTVGQLSRIISGVFESPELQNIYLTGEILQKNERSGHFYLDIGDFDGTPQKKAIITAIVWKSRVDRTGVRSCKVGDIVVLKGGLNYYAGNSRVSFIVTGLEVSLTGEGKALLAKNNLLKKLDSMGLLAQERKRSLPRYVDRLAVVSSPEAAGYHDILDTLSRRYPCREVKLFPAIVQGAQAPDSISKALREAYAWKPDAIILGRGGGSKSDLSCFDDERVALAIADSPCPLITAIGHQVDISVADRIADVYAITPTDAASMINPSFVELEEEIAQFRQELSRTLGHLISNGMMGVMDLRQRLTRLLPQAKISSMASRVQVYRERIKASASQSILGARTRLESLRRELIQRLNTSLKASETFLDSARRQLASSSVETNLKKGYAIVTSEDGKSLNEGDFSPGRKVVIRTDKVSAKASIDSVKRRV